MILVTGGTGIVGSRVVRGLMENQQPVRIMARGLSDWKDNPMPQFRKLGVDVISGDLRNSDRVLMALQGCTAVIHCANIMQERSGETFESVNVAPTDKLIELAEQAGVQRFIYVGCLGSAQYSSSKYLRSKWQGEDAVRASKFFWTIFRPSLIFAEGSQCMRAIEFWTSRTPFLFIIGSGLNHIQPVSADDVAACIVQSIYNRDTVHQTYDLVGTRSYDLTELLELSGNHFSGKQRPSFKVPSSLSYRVANLISMINPRSPISEEMMRVLTSEFAGDSSIMSNNFRVRLLPFESYFDTIAENHQPD